MKKTWIVVADQNMARFLSWNREQHLLLPIGAITSGAAPTNASYARHSTNSLISAFNSKNDEGARFAYQLAVLLAEAKRKEQYDRLHLSAAPHFLNQLREVLSTEVIDSIVEAGNKNVVHLSSQELTQFFFERATA